MQGAIPEVGLKKADQIADIERVSVSMLVMKRGKEKKRLYVL